MSSDKEEAKRTVSHILKSAFARLHECGPEVKSKLASHLMNMARDIRERFILRLEQSEARQKYEY